MEEMKYCPGCTLEKHQQGFNKDSSRKDGLERLCRECSNKRQRQKYYKNPEKHRARYRKNYADWRRSHPISPKPPKEAKPKRVKHTESYYQRHRETTILRSIDYQKTHQIDRRDYYREYRKKKRAEEPEKEVLRRRFTAKRRRARKAGAEGYHTAIDLRTIYREQNGCCAYCCSPISTSEIHFDHIVPLSRHGSEWPTNLVASCMNCNLFKSSKLLFSEWKPPNPLPQILDKLIKAINGNSSM